MFIYDQKFQHFWKILLDMLVAYKNGIALPHFIRDLDSVDNTWERNWSGYNNDENNWAGLPQ